MASIASSVSNAAASGRAGVGIGGIQGTVTSEIPIHEEEYDTYDVRYQNNPVGYLGVGFGSKPVKGIQVGFDLGILTTAGPTVTRTTDPEEAAEHPDIADITGDITNNIFFGRMLGRICTRCTRTPEAVRAI